MPNTMWHLKGENSIDVTVWRREEIWVKAKETKE